MRPYITDGTIEGFEVYRLADDSALRTFGLEIGDIIKIVNGQPIDSDLDVVGIYDSLNERGPFTLSVVRNGKPITLSKEPKWLLNLPRRLVGGGKNPLWVID